jgi:hypothetical protein
MTGLHYAKVRFDGPRPTLAQLLERAEAMGGMALGKEDNLVFLADFPQEIVRVHLDDEKPDVVDLTDCKGEWPVVMLLLEHALVALGGRADVDPEPLRLPLTRAFLRRDRWRRWGSAGIGFVVIGAALLVLPVALIATIWGVWKFAFGG